MQSKKNPSEHGSVDLSDVRARAVDEAGRRAGAALRSPAPADGAAAIRGRAHRRRAVRVAASTTSLGVLLVAGVVVFTTDHESVEFQRVDTPTVTNPDTTDSNAPALMESLDLVEEGTLIGLPWPRYSADNSLLAIESSNGNVVIHDSGTLTPIRELPCPTSLESLPDSAGTAASQDWVWDVAAAARWDPATFTVLTSVSRPRMCEVSMSADGTRAVTDADVQEASGRSLLWDTSDGSLVAVIPGLLSGFSADGSRLVMSNGPSFSIVDSSSGAVLSTVTDEAVGTVTSPDGGRLLRWGSDTHPEGAGEATIYDTQTLKPIATLSTRSQEAVAPIEDPVFDGRSGRIAALDPSGLKVWDASTGAQLQHVPIQLVGGRSVAFFPGGAMIAVRNGSHITIIDSSSGVQLADLDLGPDRVEEVVFSADGVWLAAGGGKGARVWSYKSTPVTAAPDADQGAAVTATTTPANPAQDPMMTLSVDPDGDDATPLRVTYQAPTDLSDGWSTRRSSTSPQGRWFGAVKFLPDDADGVTALFITTVSNLVSDACQDHTPLDPPVGPTVEDLAVALTRLTPFDVTAPPTDVTLFGYEGKHLELTVPALTVTGAGPASSSKNIAQFTDCVDGELYSWISPINFSSAGLLGHSSDSGGAFNAYQAPGQTEEFWILDVEGTRVVLVSFDTPGAPAADVAERDAMFESIRMEP